MNTNMLVFVTMVFVQFGYAGMNILSKLAMDSGMDPLVHVAYRQLFGAFVIIPIAYFLERGRRPEMTLQIFGLIFLSSIVGVTINQITYFLGLKFSTPTIACALTNLLPALTFLLAILFKIENVGIRNRAGQAKVLGTALCVSGAMIISFFHGPTVPIGQSFLHWGFTSEMGHENNSGHVDFFPGPLLLIVSALAWAAWFIIQARLGETYPAPYSSCSLMLMMASVECVILCLIVKGVDLSTWALYPGIRAISTVYAGVICSAVSFCSMSWCIDKKGPLYVSVFSPLLLVIMAVVSWLLLGDKIYTGTLIGSFLIVAGLYGVVWGKKKETVATGAEEDTVAAAADSESGIVAEVVV